MERIVLVNCLVICAVVLLLGHTPTTALPHNKGGDSRELDCSKENCKDTRTHTIWMGARVGRRKRDPRFNEVFRNQDPVDQDQLEELIEMLQEAPWAVVALKDGKRHTMNFTPRLGRDSNEENLDNEAEERWLQDPELAAELFQRSPPFAPRLGRRISAFSPRLGRENDRIQK